MSFQAYKGNNYVTSGDVLMNNKEEERLLKSPHIIYRMPEILQYDHEIWILINIQMKKHISQTD